ncbi:MAG: ABC transporter ATP-binding protein [Sphaerochaetaceae bacterium]
MIDIEAVTKRYSPNKRPAVDLLSLHVDSGEIFGFLGPNGAGKSTTIRMMVGLLRQDTGTIKVCGYDNIAQNVEMKRCIGYVPDEPLFYENMSGRKYLDFISDVFDIDQDTRIARIAKWAGRFSLIDALDDKISSYSRGMKQKLGVIAALIHDSRILVLDEPMVGLDPKSAFVLKEVMREFCNTGGTVFFSTHVMDVAERLCDTVGIINKGALIASGTFASLKESTGENQATLEQLFLELTDEEVETNDTHSRV